MKKVCFIFATLLSLGSFAQMSKRVFLYEVKKTGERVFSQERGITSIRSVTAIIEIEVSHHKCSPRIGECSNKTERHSKKIQVYDSTFDLKMGLYVSRLLKRRLNVCVPTNAGLFLPGLRGGAGVPREILDEFYPVVGVVTQLKIENYTSEFLEVVFIKEVNATSL